VTRPAKWAGPIYRRVAVNELHNPKLKQLGDLHHRIWAECRLGLQSHRFGVCRFSIAHLAEDLGRDDIAIVRTAFLELVDALGWYYDAPTRWLFIPETLKVSWDGGPTQFLGFKREIARLAPPAELLKRFLDVAEHLKTPPTESAQDLPLDGDTHPIPIPESGHTHGIKYSDSYSDQNSYTDEDRAAAPPSPPRPKVVRLQNPRERRNQKYSKGRR
jgi:hypothetical protein